MQRTPGPDYPSLAVFQWRTVGRFTLHVNCTREADLALCWNACGPQDCPCFGWRQGFSSRRTTRIILGRAGNLFRKIRKLWALATHDVGVARVLARNLGVRLEGRGGLMYNSMDRSGGLSHEHLIEESWWKRQKLYGAGKGRGGIKKPPKKYLYAYSVHRCAQEGISYFRGLQFPLQGVDFVSSATAMKSIFRASFETD